MSEKCLPKLSQNHPKASQNTPQAIPDTSNKYPKNVKNRTCGGRESNPRPPGCEAAGPTTRLIPRWRSGPKPISYASKIRAEWPTKDNHKIKIQSGQRRIIIKSQNTEWPTKDNHKIKKYRVMSKIEPAGGGNRTHDRRVVRPPAQPLG